MRFLLLLLLCPVLSLQAQGNLKIYYEKTKDGYKIYADNYEYAPVTVELDFKLTNLRVSYGNKPSHTLKPNRKRQYLSELTVRTKGQAYQMSYKYISNFGDHSLKTYDEDYEYFLPYKNSEGFKIMQGYKGSFSHIEKYALDFSMPEGTEITAVREGTVIKIVQHHERSCASIECAVINNYILIYHPDGTFSSYSHIILNGAKVVVGDKVEKGQVIAHSGNVGFSTGPHLHLEIYLAGMKENKTIPTRFLVNNGDEFTPLEEKKTYIRNY